VERDKRADLESASELRLYMVVVDNGEPMNITQEGRSSCALGE
jgi:hypothetical protein